MDRELVLEWLRFADMDLDAAEVVYCHRPQHLGIICYHCQQAAEKYLKGYLVFCDIEDIPRTHNLAQLCVMCMNYDKKFAEITMPCSALTAYGVLPRYPDEIFLDEHLVQKAIEHAKQVKAFVVATMGENSAARSHICSEN